jgi:transposase
LRVCPLGRKSRPSFTLARLVVSHHKFFSIQRKGKRMTKIVKQSRENHTEKNKKKQIKINSLKTLRKVCDNVAGIDVGGEFHYVAAPDPKYEGKIVVNRFGSFTTNLDECVKWLKQSNIKSVAMEATGVYWTILYAMLKVAKINVLLVNPRDFKKIKDKKTDVCDAEYLQLYHSYGLLEGAVIPEQKIGELRTFTRLREQSVEESATAIQRMQKALINMNLRLDNVLNDISGVTGLTIIRAILNGERDPKVLAAYRDKRCKKSEEEIEDSLKGFYQEDQLFALRRALRQYEFHLQEIEKCEEEIQTKLREFDTHINYRKVAQVETLLKEPKKRKSARKPHEFSFNLREEIIRITGADLTLLPAIGVSTALTLVAETGLDMRVWKSEKHFTSWLGISANNKVSGGRILQNRTKRKKKKAAITLRMAVSSLYSEANDTALGAFFRRKRAHIGAAKAITAAASKLARMYYKTMLTGRPFEEPGAKAYQELQKEKYLRNVRKQIKSWGLKLTPIETPVETATEVSIKT